METELLEEGSRYHGDEKSIRLPTPVGVTPRPVTPLEIPFMLMCSNTKLLMLFMTVHE